MNHILTGLLERIGDEFTADSLRVHHHESKAGEETDGEPDVGVEKNDLKPTDKDTAPKA